MYKSFPKLFLLSSCSVFCLTAMAGGPEIIQAGWWPYPTGATATALSGELTTGFADGMIPVYGKPTGFFYVDPQGQINNSDQYAVSAGVGGRYLIQNKGIIGAYVFGDYNHSQYNNSFWFVSPGVEFLGDSFDVTGNLYIPVGTQKYNTGNAVFGQDIGIYDGVTFAVHTEYDELYQTTETNGFGGDIDVAYRIPLNKYNPKLHLAGYFSNPEDAEKNRAGGAVRLEFPFSKHFSVLIADSYDNVSYNTVRAGASYSFGGRHTSYNYKHDLEGRMVDPIQRNIIANTSDIRNSQPISENTLKEASGSSVYLDNITFFIPDPDEVTLLSASGNGTYEHPYTGMSQDQIDAANTAGNRNFFVQSGTYGDSSTGMGSLLVENDFVIGRESYNGNPFVKQAQETRRPEFIFAASGFSVGPNDLNTTLSSLFLRGVGGYAGDGITFLQQNNGQVDTLDNMQIAGFRNGVAASSTTAVTADVTLNVRNSSINDLSIDAIHYNVAGTGGVFTMNVENTSMGFMLEGINIISDGNQEMVINLNNFVASSSNRGGLVVQNGSVASLAGATINMTNSTCTHNTLAFSNCISISNSSQGLLTFVATGSAIDQALSLNTGDGILLDNFGAGGIFAVFNDTTVSYHADSGLKVVQEAGATGNINVLIENGSQFIARDLAATEAAILTTTAGPGSTGQINMTVDNTVGNPVLWSDDLVRNVGGGAITATFLNADGSSRVLSGGSNINIVYCGPVGFCTVQ